MEESKIQALHDTLSKLRKSAGLGVASHFNFGSATTKTDSNEKVIRTDGLPNNALYANFLREGDYNPSKSNANKYGDGRLIKTDFSDCAGVCEVSGGESSGENSDSLRKKKIEKKQRKKAEKKAAKLEAKRQAKLEEKRRAKRGQKILSQASAVPDKSAEITSTVSSSDKHVFQKTNKTKTKKKPKEKKLRKNSNEQNQSSANYDSATKTVDFVDIKKEKKRKKAKQNDGRLGDRDKKKKKQNNKEKKKRKRELVREQGIGELLVSSSGSTISSIPLSPPPKKRRKK